MSEELVAAASRLPADRRELVDERHRFLTLGTREADPDGVLMAAVRDMLFDLGQRVYGMTLEHFGMTLATWVAIHRMRRMPARVRIDGAWEEPPAFGAHHAGGHATGTTDGPRLAQVQCCRCGCRQTCVVDNPERIVAIGQVAMMGHLGRAYCWPCWCDDCAE